jgi:hypothetical protein
MLENTMAFSARVDATRGLGGVGVVVSDERGLGLGLRVHLFGDLL